MAFGPTHRHPTNGLELAFRRSPVFGQLKPVGVKEVTITTAELAQARRLMEDGKTDLAVLSRFRELHAVGSGQDLLDGGRYGPESGMTVPNLACESNRLGEVLTSLHQFLSERPIPSQAGGRRAA